MINGTNKLLYIYTHNTLAIAFDKIKTYFCSYTNHLWEKVRGQRHFTYRLWQSSLCINHSTINFMWPSCLNGIKCLGTGEYHEAKPTRPVKKQYFTLLLLLSTCNLISEFYQH